MKDLAARLDALCDTLPFQTSWYLKDWATGVRADRLGNVPVPSASTRKISIMMAALKAVHDGKLALDQKVTIDAKYQDNDSGTFQHLTPGFWITFRDALVTKVAHKTGTGSRGFMDAGIVFKDDHPLFILTAYTEHVPAALPDGTPGFAAAYQVIGKMARLSWDTLGG